MCNDWRCWIKYVRFLIHLYLVNFFKDASDDVEGAISAGMNGILVRTGKYRSGIENSMIKKPLLVADNFANAVDYLISSFSN